MKYGNKKIDTPDGRFDSRGEYRRWQDLKLLEKVGELFNLKRQVKYVIIPKQTGKSGKKYREATYTADFVYEEPQGMPDFPGAKNRLCTMHYELVVEDFKSPITAKEPSFVMKKKLMLERHGIEIRITGV